ncbi:MAG TPA: hypothetical protein VGI81_14505 [Tepidisphaeraceae bacterium]|jgi:hypothetical protein
MRPPKGWLMMNDSANSYYANCRWADAGRNASGFYSTNNQPLQYSPHGYPVGTAIAARSNLWLLGCPAGDYNVNWQGNATINISGSGGVAWKRIDANHGTLTLPAPCKMAQTQWGPSPNEMSYIDVSSSDPANPLDALHIWLPGYGPGTRHAGQIFHDQHLAIVRKFSGVRCMNSLNVASGHEENWAERVTMDMWDWSTKAVPIEADIELAREARLKRLWVNIPIKANDDYIRNSARLYHDKLHGVELIVELGNENWNWGGGFIGWPTVHNIANNVKPEAFDGAIVAGKLVPDDHDSDGKPILVTDEYVRSVRCTAERAREVAMIFQDVYRDRPRELLNIFCGCSADPRWITLGLEFLTAKYGGQPFQLIGIAPYVDFWANNGQYCKPTGPNGTYVLADLFTACDAYLSDTNQPGIPWQLAQHQALAQQYGVRLVDYEGGQHFFPQDKPYTGKDLSTQAQTDPRMGAMYDKYFATLHKYGVAMHCDFVPIGEPWNQSGYWAALQDYADTGPTNYRWAALLRESAKSN